MKKILILALSLFALNTHNFASAAPGTYNPETQTKISTLDFIKQYPEVVAKIGAVIGLGLLTAATPLFALNAAAIRNITVAQKSGDILCWLGFGLLYGYITAEAYQIVKKDLERIDNGTYRHWNY
jgi:hypothetical protein